MLLVVIVFTAIVLWLLFAKGTRPDIEDQPATDARATEKLEND